VLTFVTWPKPFVGVTAATQRTAIRTWALAAPDTQVILFGDEEGTAEAAAELGAEHSPELERNEFGTALLNDLIARTRVRARHELLCLANADVAFGDGLREAVARARWAAPRFLLIGRCREIAELGREADRAEIAELARFAPLREPGALDYFVFPRDLFVEVPAFALGRAGFDNWLVWRARQLAVPVFDATEVVTAVHQRHGYDHVQGGERSAYTGVEAQRNVELAGGWLHLYNVEDATHTVTAHGIHRNWKAHLRSIAPLRRLALAASGVLHGRRGPSPGRLAP
jgi:hypothetical protein